MNLGLLQHGVILPTGFGKGLSESDIDRVFLQAAIGAFATFFVVLAIALIVSPSCSDYSKQLSVQTLENQGTCYVVDGTRWTEVTKYIKQTRKGRE